MIARIWHGWTAPENADTYEQLLKTEIFPGIFNKRIAGFRRVQLLRQNVGQEVEFITIMWFSSLEAVKGFVGEDYERAYVPDAARKVLKRFDSRSAHYALEEDREVGEAG